jgi:hypothetical protein
MDILLSLKDTPVPAILVIGGIIFLLLAIAPIKNLVVEKLSNQQRKLSGIVGVVLMLCGIALYSIPIQTSQNTKGDPSVMILEPLSTNNLSVKLVDGWAVFKVSGVSANVQSNQDLRIVILVRSTRPYVAGWWRQLPAVVNPSNGDWQAEAQIGNQVYPPNIGDELEILAAVISYEQLKRDPHINDIKDVKPVAISETIKFTISEIK